MRPGPVSLGNCRAHFCLQPMYLARSHEEATTDSDCGDAGTRCAVAACADHFDSNDDDSDDDEEDQGESRNRRAAGHPGVAGEDGRSAGPDRRVEGTECREGRCALCCPIDRSQRSVAGCDRPVGGCHSAVAGAECHRRGAVAVRCSHQPEEHGHRPAGRQRRAGRYDQPNQAGFKRQDRLACRDPLQRRDHYSGCLLRG